jgi:hypothetical protein
LGGRPAARQDGPQREPEGDDALGYEYVKMGFKERNQQFDKRDGFYFV